MSRTLLIIGSSGHARVCIDIARKMQTLKLVGLLDDFREVGEVEMGVQIIGKIADLPALLDEFKSVSLFVAIGDNWRRSLVVEKVTTLLGNSIKFATLIHPGTQIAEEVSVGIGSVIMPGAVINSSTQIQEFCIVNTNASIDHDGIMHRFSSLSPGAILGGNVTVGEFSAVGLGASIIEKCTIGNHTVVGAGSTVINDIEDHVLAYGTPARPIRARQTGEPYLK